MKTSIINIVYFTVFAFCFFHKASAQKQANFWFTDNFYIDFNHTPPKINTITLPDNGASHYASIADHKGDLLFFTDGENVYNKNFEIMPNGLTGVDYNYVYYGGGDIIIIPQPFTSNYFFFMPSYLETGFILTYAVVDMSLNNGLGDLSNKAKALPLSNLHGYVSTGNCDKFWLLTTMNTRIDSEQYNYILRYQIDKTGLSVVPDSIKIEGIDFIGNLKFSPDSKKLIFSGFKNYDSYAIRTTFLFDFNKLDGTISNEKRLFVGRDGKGLFEFSPNSKLLYLTSYSNNGKQSNLYQYDISFSSIDSIENSAILLHEGSPDIWVGHKKITPFGSMYCEQASEIGTNKMAIIDFPDKKGLACSFRINAINYALFGMPNFVSTFLSPQFDENFDIHAGDSQELCTDISIDLGQEPTYDIQYSWRPENYLSNSGTANPIFLYKDTITVKTDFQYVLEGQKGYCYNTDTVTLIVYPNKKTPISGSNSVCPGVMEVDYWAEADERFGYEWSANGGDVVVNQNTDTIKVNWGTTNSNANVTMVPYNSLDCPSDPIIFPVRINVELQTETPAGDELLCSNLATEIPYRVINTNGSVYTWESDYGDILAGQGTNEVTANWPGDGKYNLWVKEQSTTIDTVCYGVSDSLLVKLFTDSTKLEIDYASVLEEDANSYELQWYASDTSRLTSEIAVYSRQPASSWELLYSASKTENGYQFPDTLTPMSFKISSVNGCKEYIESEVHTTIFLEGEADSSSNAMNLSWTPYIGWANNIEQYEVWYKKDEENSYGLVASFKPGQMQWSNNWGADAFEHRYRIRALHAAYPFESWSNEIKLDFNHDIEIPNVFTPNGDGINETFSFPKLELFHENELIVVDRNGREVFTKSNYAGDWNGGRLAAGVYYYSLLTKRNGKYYKGWLQILR